MERYKVLLAREADADIRNILRYISVNLKERSTAETMLNRFRETILSLETMPERFALVSNGYLASMGVRMAFAGNYLFFYTVNTDEARVNILRVLYGRQNWIDILTNDMRP